MSGGGALLRVDRVVRAGGSHVPKSRLRVLALIPMVLGPGLSGCGASTAVETKAALGKVVVYRNGVAYFERRAVVSDGELKLRVPGERVDDFLKSLTVVDAKTGKLAAGVASPPSRHGGDEVDDDDRSCRSRRRASSWSAT